jgi:hypothetical protein
MNNINFTLSSNIINNLENFSELLKKDYNVILNEALEQYFINEEKKLLEKNIDGENAMTNLDFDEFWDDVDI